MDQISIGAKIRQLRKERGYTLRQLSQETGLSTGFLSQLERGISSVPIDSLVTITRIFGVALSDFFAESKEDDNPVRRGLELTPTMVSPQIAYYDHSSGGDFELFPRVFHLLPFAEEEARLEMNHHAGEELVYVLEGIVHVYIAGDEYVLYPGDSVQIHSNVPHNWINRTSKPARLLTVNYPHPLRR